MKTIKEYLSEYKIKKVSPDPAEAESLIKQAFERLMDLLSLPLTETNSPFRFEDAYECIREAVQAFMAKEGLNPYSHEAIIAFGREKKLLDEREAFTLDRYREKRNDINYRGQKVTLEEAKGVISLAKEIVVRLKKRFYS